MFSDRARGSRADAAASEWLSEVLRARVALVHMGDPRNARPLTAAGAARGERLSYADAYPVLLASSASLAALNEALGDRVVGMERFRPNVVVEGAEAWAEERWTEVATEGARFRGATDCQRCVVITVDQREGAIPQPGEPLKTLARLGRGESGLPLFGRNLIPAGPGVVRVGDGVHAVAAGGSDAVAT